MTIPLLLLFQEVLKREFERSRELFRSDKRQSDQNTPNEERYTPDLSEEHNALRSYSNIRNHDRDTGRFHQLKDTNSEEEYFDNFKYPSIEMSHEENQDRGENDGSGYSQVVFENPRGAIIEPPPLEVPELKVDALEYPAYQLLALSDKLYSPDERDHYVMPSEQYNGFIYKKRRRR